MEGRGTLEKNTSRDAKGDDGTHATCADFFNGACLRKGCKFKHTFIAANEFLPPMPLDDYDGTGCPEVAQYLVKDDGRPGENNALKLVFHVSSSRCGGPQGTYPCSMRSS